MLLTAACFLSPLSHSKSPHPNVSENDFFFFSGVTKRGNSFRSQDDFLRIYALAPPWLSLERPAVLKGSGKAMASRFPIRHQCGEYPEQKHAGILFPAD